MDTAAAAAAAVVVDLNAESSKLPLNTTKLLSKSKTTTNYSSASCTKIGSTADSCKVTDCLGSTVEAMSATPPPMQLNCCTAMEAADAAAPLNGRICNNAEAPGSEELATNATCTELCPAEYFALYATQPHAYSAFEPQQQSQPQQPQPQQQTQSSPELSTPLTPTTSTSSTNASTTPTSALLTPNNMTTSSATSPVASTPASVATTPTSNASNISSPISSMIPTPEELLQWQDMPKYLQFNPYVLRGYRPLTTFRGCLLSLFYWHNETINILTHAIPIIYILAIVPGLMPWDRGYRFLSFCHLFGSVAPWCGSFVYHLFMNIEKGENIYYTLLKLDMVGIWVSQSFGALPLVTATTLCFTPILKWFIIISYCLLSLWGLYKALTASSPWQRRLCFALPFSMRSVLTFLRIRGLVGGSHMALSHVYLQVQVDGVSILGGAIGAMRIPEKWFPGLVDFYLNSHNIMHVLVVVAVYSMHKATIKDFEWMSTQTCNSYENATEDALSHVEL